MVVPGLVTVAGVVTGALLFADRDFGSTGGPIAGCFVTGLATTALVAAYAVVRRQPAHVFVPLVGTVAVPVAVATGGPFHDGRAIAVWWGAAAFVVHLAIASRRLAAALVAVGVVASAWLVGRVGQETWQAEDLRAVGVPLVVVDVPGFTPYRAGAGRERVEVILADQPHRGRRITQTIYRSRCASTAPTLIDDTVTSSVRLCAAGHVVVARTELIYSQPGATGEPWSIEPLVPSMTVRPVTAEDLARLGDVTPWEDD
ncbi:hypothetical protein AB0J82_11740 [Asanoa sp. NPDC049518]|uniref:hypothetical protein n=1 Tax=unclassified Asanoa TaxID=2685164 RepID=UPI00344A679F